MALIECPECEKQISSAAESCPHCGNPMASNQIKCQNCKSTNVEKISTKSKIGSALLIGVFAVGRISKTYKCNDCGFRW